MLKGRFSPVAFSASVFLVLKCDLAIRCRGLLKPYSMSKKHTISGFRQPYIDEEVSQSEETKSEGPSIEEQLVDLICQRYSPVETLQESSDQKTTLELIDEMESFSEVYKTKIVLAMKDKGFKPYYTGESFVWLLKENS